MENFGFQTSEKSAVYEKLPFMAHAVFSAVYSDKNRIIESTAREGKFRFMTATVKVNDMEWSHCFMV